MLTSNSANPTAVALKKKEIPPATAPNSCPKELIGIADSFKNTSFGVGVPFQEAMMDDYQEKMQTRTEQRNYIVFDSNQHRPESQSECDRNLSRYSSVWYLLTCLEQPPVISNGGCDCCDLSSILEQTNLWLRLINSYTVCFICVYRRALHRFSLPRHQQGAIPGNHLSGKRSIHYTIRFSETANLFWCTVCVCKWSSNCSFLPRDKNIQWTRSTTVSTSM